jgi:hypothetical protein
MKQKENRKIINFGSQRGVVLYIPVERGERNNINFLGVLGGFSTLAFVLVLQNCLQTAIKTISGTKIGLCGELHF